MHYTKNNTNQQCSFRYAESVQVFKSRTSGTSVLALLHRIVLAKSFSKLF